MSETLAGVDVFVAAVDAGGFAAAASRLNLSRSAVGKTVAKLETRFGVRLFHRTTRALALTEDGQLFYERCLRALEELRAGRAVLDSGRKEAVGRLRVSMPVLFGRRCVAPVLTRLAAEHPRLELDLNFTDRLVDLTEDGFDLAVRNGAVGDGAALMQRRIALQRMTVCAAPAYVAQFGAPTSVEDLMKHHAVAYGRAGRSKAWLFPREGAEPLEITPPSRMRFDDLTAITDAAAEGLGIAWLPCWLVRDRVKTGELVPLLTEVPRHVFQTFVVWPQSPHMPLRVRLAIDALAAELPGSAEL